VEPSAEIPVKKPAPASTDSQTAQSVEPESRPASEPAEPEEPIDISKLPDLTQGLPSTLEYEMAGATDKAALATLQEAEAGAGRGGRGKGELPASAYVSSQERRRQAIFNYMFVLSAVGLVVGTVYLGREWEDAAESSKNDIPNGWSLGLWWKRAKARLGDTLSYYHEPAFEKLLPDPNPSFERPYTLCISMEDMLVHNEWSRDHGWRVAKRPGMDYFLRYLSQYYEIVLFTTVPFSLGEPVVRKLDPYHFITWPLFREATKYKDGEVVKVSFRVEPRLPAR
jgi:import inner membrane translocase subunit TIM50